MCCQLYLRPQGIHKACNTPVQGPMACNLAAELTDQAQYLGLRRYQTSTVAQDNTKAALNAQ
eukprot:255165-Pelagomonas_calceolata.AAC.1